MSQNHAWFKKHPWIKHFNMTEYENISIRFLISYCKKPLRNYAWWVLGYYPKTVSTKIRKWKSVMSDSEVPWNVVHGILQARILEWVTFPSPWDLSNSGIEPQCPALQVDSLPAEPQGKPTKIRKNYKISQPFFRYTSV